MTILPRKAPCCKKNQKCRSNAAEERKGVIRKSPAKQQKTPLINHKKKREGLPNHPGSIGSFQKQEQKRTNEPNPSHSQATA
jgi:hypothetical protein